MKLPDATEVTSDALHAIAARHGLRADSCAQLPTTGIINTVYLIGDDFVLRVPRNHPAHVRQARTEAVAVPAARAAGVQTPRLVAFDDALDLLPVPYMIFERVRGETLGLLDLEPGDAATAWRGVGHDLALLHTGVSMDGPAGSLESSPPRMDPRALAEQRAVDGWFSTAEVRWLIRWLDRLAPAATSPVPKRFVHGDVQATNVMVSADGGAYRTLIDWGCAQWDDPARDLGGMPLRAVPYVLAGHREVTPLDGEDTAEARILWHHFWVTLHLLPLGAAPGCSWGEQPTAMLLDIMRFFLESPGGRWQHLAP